MLDRNEPIREYLARVDRAGGKTTPEFERIRSGWARMFQPRDTFGEALAAILADDPDALDRAFTSTVVAVSSDTLKLRDRLANDIGRELVKAYKPSAVANYKAAAKAFDKTASALTATAELAPPAATAEAMIPESDDARAAWQQALPLARELDKLASTLFAAAGLAGIRVLEGNGTKALSGQIALTCDPTGQHRRRLWEAFGDTTHRLGRWGRLLEMHVPIRAWSADNIEAFAPYGEPPAIEVHQERVNHGAGVWGVAQIEVDPADYEHSGEPMPVTTKPLPRARQVG